MKYKKKNEFFTAEVELSEAEIQSMLSIIEENMVLRQLPFTEIKGLRKEVYDGLNDILNTR